MRAHACHNSMRSARTATALPWPHGKGLHMRPHICPVLDAATQFCSQAMQPVAWGSLAGGLTPGAVTHLNRRGTFRRAPLIGNISGRTALFHVPGTVQRLLRLPLCLRQAKQRHPQRIAVLILRGLTETVSLHSCDKGYIVRGLEKASAQLKNAPFTLRHLKRAAPVISSPLT